MPIAPKSHRPNGRTPNTHKPAYNKPRKSAATRGYDYQWQKYRKQYLSINPVCVMCQSNGKVSPATVVDHIQPVSGKYDPLFYAVSNHQALCRDCHSHKTRMIDKRGFGAPGGGVG